MTDNDILVLLRDLFEAADGTDPELESADVDRAALIEFLRQGIARHRSAALAAATQTRAASIVRRKAIEPRLSPFEGAWQVVNPTESTFALEVGADASVDLPPGASFVDHDPRDALAKHVEAGTLMVNPPGLHDETWLDGLSQLSFERRAVVASKVADATALRECLPRVRQVMKANIRQRLEVLAAAPVEPPPAQHAKRLRASAAE